MLVALLIFLATIVLVIWQPRGLGIGWSAMLGASAALLSGVIYLSDIPAVWQIVWNATATFIAIIISLLLDEAGFLNGRHARCALGWRERPAAVCFYHPAWRVGFCLVCQ